MTSKRASQAGDRLEVSRFRGKGSNQFGGRVRADALRVFAQAIRGLEIGRGLSPALQELVGTLNQHFDDLSRFSRSGIARSRLSHRLTAHADGRSATNAPDLVVDDREFILESHGLRLHVVEFALPRDVFAQQRTNGRLVVGDCVLLNSREVGG